MYKRSEPNQNTRRESERRHEHERHERRESDRRHESLRDEYVPARPNHSERRHAEHRSNHNIHRHEHSHGNHRHNHEHSRGHHHEHNHHEHCHDNRRDECRDHHKPRKKDKNPILGFIPTSIYNPEDGKILGFLSVEDLILIALILMFLDSDEEGDNLMVYALIYVLASDWFDMEGFLGKFL